MNKTKESNEESAEENEDEITDNTEIEYVTDSDGDELLMDMRYLLWEQIKARPSTRDENGKRIDSDGDTLSDIEE